MSSIWSTPEAYCWSRDFIHTEYVKHCNDIGVKPLSIKAFTLICNGLDEELCFNNTTYKGEILYLTD